MKIEFNKVTWYSRALAWLVFIILPFWGFYLGYKYGEVKVFNSGIFRVIPADKDATSELSFATSSWLAFNDSQYGFSFKYPMELSPTGNPDNFWKYFSSSTSTGREAVLVTIPRIFEMGTNFGDARFSVGVSSDKADLQNCFLPGNGEEASSTVYINGNMFYRFVGSDAGAGNFYQVESFRTMHSGACYDLDLIIHSTNISNYPAEFNIQKFDYDKVHNLLSAITQSFEFTK